MKKLKNILFSTLFIILSLFTLTACGNSPYKSLDVQYAGSYDYDTAKNVIMVEYGDVINFSLDDFNAVVTFENGKSKKTDKVTMDASSVNHKAPAVGDYKIYFSYMEQNDKFEITVRIYEKAVVKEYFTPYKTTYSGNIVDVENYITSLPVFNSEYMEIDKSISTISATNAGEYKVYIALKPGYVWNTATGKYTAIEFIWKIEKKQISIPTVSGETTFTYKFDAAYAPVSQTLLFDENQNEKDFYIISNNSTSLAGNYTASVKIKDQFKNNYCFTDQTDEKTFDYQILPYQLDKVALSDSGRYTYSGEAISPNLSNFIAEIMTKSDISNNVDAGVYSQTIELKAGHKTNYVWKNESAISAVRINYEIQKRHIARPVLAQTEYTYTGKAIAPEFTNLDENLAVSDTSVNIGVGTYPITIRLKSTLNPANFTLEGADSASSIVYNYTIVARTFLISLSWDKPENATYTGSTQFVNLFISGEGVENFNIKTNYKYYLKDSEGNYNEVDNLISAGEYRIVATLSYDNVNNILRVNENPPREILASDLETTLTVAKAEIDCSALSLLKSTPMYTGSAITPNFTEINNLTISKVFEIYQNDKKIDSIVNAGTYTVKISVSYDENNYELVNFTDEFTLTVKPKTISTNDFAWDYSEAFTYDMTEKTVLLVCKDYDFVIITYENNKATAPGTYTATATVSLPAEQTNYVLNANATSFPITFEIVRGEPLLKVSYEDFEFYYDAFEAGVDTNFTLRDEIYYKAQIIKEGITSLDKITLKLSSKEGVNKFDGSNRPNEYGYCDFTIKDNKCNISLNGVTYVFVIELCEPAQPLDPAPVSIKIGDKSFDFALSTETNVNNDFSVQDDGSLELELKASDFDIEGKTEIKITFTFLNDQVGVSDKTYIFTTDENVYEGMGYPTVNFVDVSTLSGTLSATLTVSIVDGFITIYVSTEADGDLYLYTTITIMFA